MSKKYNIELNEGHIYLLEFIENNDLIYKIGYSEQMPLSRRLNCYKNYTIKFKEKHKNCTYLEKQIIKNLKMDFEVYKGNEWYKGDVIKMCRIIQHTIKQYTIPENYVILNKLIEYETMHPSIEQKYLYELFLKLDNIDSVDLLNFTNGTYNLKNNIFNHSVSENIFNLNTHLNYSDYSYKSPEIIELVKIIYKILPEHNMREYFLHSLSSGLSDKIVFKKICILTGHDLSLMNEFIILIQNILGDYGGINCGLKTTINHLSHLKPENENLSFQDINYYIKRILICDDRELSPKQFEAHINKYINLMKGKKLYFKDLYNNININFVNTSKIFIIYDNISTCTNNNILNNIDIIKFSHGTYNLKKTIKSLQKLKEPFIWLLIQYNRHLQNLDKIPTIDNWCYNSLLGNEGWC